MTIFILCSFLAFMAYPFWLPKVCDLFVDNRLRKELESLVKTIALFGITGTEDQEFEAKINELTSNKKKLPKKKLLFVAKRYFEEALQQNSHNSQLGFEQLSELKSTVENQSWFFYQSESATMLLATYLWATKVLKVKQC